MDKSTSLVSSQLDQHNGEIPLNWGYIQVLLMDNDLLFHNPFKKKVITG
jgi:hypothetical protein